VPKDAFDLWLDCANVEAGVAAALIRPADEALLEAYPISLAVNRVANDSDVLIKPVAAGDIAQDQPVAPAKKPKTAKEPDDQASLF